MWQSYEPDFKKGDIIEYCDERFEVVENYGSTGKVKYVGDDTLILPMNWEYAGERCVKVSK